VFITDVNAILTGNINHNANWSKLKQRLKVEENETVPNCHGLKIHAAVGKMQMTDVDDTKQLFRLIQSIPSPKPELHSIECNWDTRTLQRNNNIKYLNRALELPNEQISQDQFVKTLIFFNF